MVYLCVPHIYMEWFKRKCPKHSLSSRNPRDPNIQAIKPIQVIRPSGTFGMT